MRRLAIGVALSVSALSIGLPGCGDDDEPGPTERGGAGGSGASGNGGRGGSGASDDGGEAGGTPEGGAGQGGTTNGGGGTGARGGASGNGGTSANGGTSGTSQGGTGDAGGEGGGGGAGGEPDQLSICTRLVQPGSLAFDVTLAYEDALIDDCRVNWVTILYYDSSIGLNERDRFLNNLLIFNLRLWGCQATAPADFALIYRPAPLTSADAQTIIDDYIGVAASLLSMSQPEISEMRALLGRLSESTIEEVSDEYSNPNCGAGGAGGAGT